MKYKVLSAIIAANLLTACGGGRLVLFDSVGNYNSKGIRAVQSFESQSTHQKQAIEEILSKNSCWYCE